MIPLAVALVGLVGLSVLVLAAQTVFRAPLVPGPWGLLQMTLGLVPEVMSIMLPVAALLATASLAKRWSESGALLAVHLAGGGVRQLLPGVVLSGLLLGTLAVFLSHIGGPWGRTQVRAAVLDAVEHFDVRPGRPMDLGEWWLRVGSAEGTALSDVLLLRSDGVVWAAKGTASVGGVITLEHGQARSLEGGDSPLWNLEFDRIEVKPGAIDVPTHPLEFGFTKLRNTIARKTARGRSVQIEKLWLYKRSTLPLSVPLLALVGLPLGVRFRQTWTLSLGVVLLLWASQRVGDHLVERIGAEWAATLPLSVLLGIAVLAWTGWRER